MRSLCERSTKDPVSRTTANRARRLRRRVPARPRHNSGSPFDAPSKGRLSCSGRNRDQDEFASPIAQGRSTCRHSSTQRPRFPSWLWAVIVTRFRPLIGTGPYRAHQASQYQPSEIRKCLLLVDLEHLGGGHRALVHREVVEAASPAVHARPVARRRPQGCAHGQRAVRLPARRVRWPGECPFTYSRSPALYNRASRTVWIASTASPAHRVVKPRRLPSTRRALTPHDLTRSTPPPAPAATMSSSTPLLLRLHTETALRRGGALALRLADLNTEQCLIRLDEKGADPAPRRNQQTARRTDAPRLRPAPRCRKRPRPPTWTAP